LLGENVPQAGTDDGEHLYVVMRINDCGRIAEQVVKTTILRVQLGFDLCTANSSCGKSEDKIIERPKRAVGPDQASHLMYRSDRPVER
jgi:hypothetical protein